MGNELIRQGKGVLFTTVPELITKLMPHPDKARDESRERMEAVKTAEVLILDDFGAERPTEFGAERLFMILDSRLREGRQMIITSNLEPRDLGRRYEFTGQGGRIVERIRRSACYVAQIHF